MPCVCSLRSTLELLEYNKWFASFTGEWVNIACTLFYNEVKKSSTESHKVSSNEIINEYLFVQWINLYISYQ